MLDNWIIISYVLFDRGFLFIFVKGGGEEIGVDGFEEYELLLFVG